MGTPTVTLVTEPFRGLAGATSRGNKIPDLPTIVLPQAYDRLPEEAIRADIRLRLPDILAAVTSASPAAIKAGARDTRGT